MTLLVGHATRKRTMERWGIRKFGERGSMGAKVFILHPNAYQRAFTAEEALSNQVDRMVHPRDISRALSNRYKPINVIATVTGGYESKSMGPFSPQLIWLLPLLNV